MGRASRTKKERRAARLRGELDDKQLKNKFRLLDIAPIIKKEDIIQYLVSKFVGKTGYKFISIGRYGSLLVNEKSTDIVAVNLHREFPETSVRGRFNDPNRLDIAVNAFHVPVDFPGIVIDRNSNVFIGDSTAAAKYEEVDNVLIDFRKVTAEEYKDAIELEQPIFKKQLDELEAKLKESKTEVERSIDEAMRTPYDDTPYDDTPYDESTPYEEVSELKMEEHCEPLVTDTPYEKAVAAEIIE